MQTIIQSTREISLVKQEKTTSLWSRFMSWCQNQEEKRFAWAAVIIMGHGCIFTILTLVAIIFTGNNFIFWPFAIGAMAIPLITNLAAMPMKVIIPVFFGSLVIDLLIIAICLANGFSVETVYPG